MDPHLKVCLEFIEVEGWTAFSFERVSKASGIPLLDFYNMFKTKAGVMTALIQMLDQKMLEELEGMEAQHSPREILFEIILTRLEIATPYKNVFQKLFEGSLSDPLSSLFISQQGLGSMVWMLEQAGLNPYGWPGMLRVQGLTILYLYTLKTWFSDASPDMGKTMATLDRGLVRVEKLAQTLGI